jgi:hypothetical protein
MDEMIKIFKEHKIYKVPNVSRYNKEDLELYKYTLKHRYEKLCEINNIIPKLDFETDFDKSHYLYYDFINGLDFLIKIKNVFEYNK